MADAVDSKSTERKFMGVRPSPRAPWKIEGLYALCRRTLPPTRSVTYPDGRGLRQLYAPFFTEGGTGVLLAFSLTQIWRSAILQPIFG